LFFAGEATIREHPATAAGAYLSGLRTAGQICNTLIGSIKVNFDVERLSEEWKSENVGSSTKARSKKKLWKQTQEQKNKHHRGKTGVNIRKAKIDGSYSWLFDSNYNYKIPKKQVSGNGTTHNKYIYSDYSKESSHVFNRTTQELRKSASADLIPKSNRNSGLSTSQNTVRVVIARSVTPTTTLTSNYSHLNYPSSSSSSSTVKSENFNPNNNNNHRNYHNPHFQNDSAPSQFNSGILSQQQQTLAQIANNLSSFMSASSLSASHHTATSTTSSFMPEEMQLKTTHLTTPNSVSKDKEFKRNVSATVIKTLSKIMKGRTIAKEEFKHLARKITHLCVQKERKINAHQTPVMTEEIQKKVKKFVVECMKTR
jgi:hypothetical protein